jgi:hypothetical protein
MQKTQDNLAGIRIGDCIAIIATAFVLGIAVATEIKEITMCRKLRQHRSDGVGRGWLFALTTLDFLRQFVLLPTMAVLLVKLVLFIGSDALNVCLNALAMIFVLQCDNYAFKALTETIQHTTEPFGVQDLTKTEVATLSRVKATYIVLITIFVPIFLMFIPPDSTTTQTAETAAANEQVQNPLNIAQTTIDAIQGLFFVAALVEAVSESAAGPPREQALAALAAVAKYAISYVLTYLFYIGTWVANHHLLRTQSSVYENLDDMALHDEYETCDEIQLAADIFGVNCH